MKGIAHFLTGLALASFFPAVVNAAESGSLLPVLGGFGGLLPDTLDFKFVQFWEAYDVEVDPGPNPNAEVIANVVLDALLKAFTTGQPIHLRAHTIKLSADTWQQYTLAFNVNESVMTISIGPVVTTTQKPAAGHLSDPVQVATRTVPMALVVPYTQRFNVDIFQGPSFLFVREGDAVNVRFLDWHHRWTHSLLLAPLVGILTALGIRWLTNNWESAVWGGALSGIGFGAHVLEDQLGYMGCNLWWPFTRTRKPGLGWFHAGDTLPNFITVWLSLVLILFNIDRFAPTPYLPATPLIFIGLGLPLVLIFIVIASRRWRNKVSTPSDELR